MDCCSRVLRAGFLVLAAPLLLTGTVFHHLGHRLQQNGLRNAEYASAELAAAGTLDKAAAESTAKAEEDQGIVLDMEGDVTANSAEAGASEVSAGEDAGIVGEDEAAAATEAGSAAIVQEVPGVNVAADAAEGTAILGQEASAVAAAGGFLKNEALAAEEGAQAAADGNLAAEKEAEAGSLQAAATTEEAASVTAKQQAGKASLLAGTYLLEAGLCELVSIAVQAPVALALLVKWSMSAATGTCSAACLSAGSMGGNSMLLPITWMISRMSLAGSIASLLAAPWAATVLTASTGSENVLAAVESAANHIASPGSRTTSGRILADGHGKHKAEEPSFLNGLNPFARPMTDTTTVRPTTLPAPVREGRWAMFGAAVHMTIDPMLRWCWPVLVDVFFMSALFAAATFAASVGKHVPAVRKGHVSSHSAMITATRDVVSCWLWGLMILLAVWVMSIILAKELRPAAAHVDSLLADARWNEFLAGRVCATLTLLCITVYILHGYVQSMSFEDDRNEFDREDAPAGSHYAPVDVEAARFSSAAAAGITSCFCTAMTGVIEVALQAVEGPINAWALGGSYKAIVMGSAVVAVTPWQNVLGSGVHLVLFAACAFAVFLLGAGTCRWLARSQARSGGSYAKSSEYGEAAE